MYFSSIVSFFILCVSLWGMLEWVVCWELEMVEIVMFDGKVKES